MSKINQYGRPYVTFDVENEEHRKIFHDIIKHNNFGRAPVRFWLENEQNNLMNQIKVDLVNYYLAKEFGSLKLKDSEQIVAGQIRTRPNPMFKTCNKKTRAKLTPLVP
jgi:hypothetical protein